MSPARSAPNEPRRTPRTLVADADGDTRLLYREWLRAAGTDVVDAVDGREAMVKALSHRPTLVITELYLPIFDGYALCQVLRRDSLTNSVPIVVVTGESRPSEVDRARDAGANVVLIKPVTREALLREIDRLLEQRAPARESNAPEPLRSATRRTYLARGYKRVTTTTPPIPPPDLRCPMCDRPLQYERSHVGGVSRRHPEQWDEYTCPRCGSFEYRHRTRKTRSL